MDEAVAIVVLVIQLYLLVTVLDVLLAWIQEDPARWPRRAFHLVTEPLQGPVRRVLPDRLTGGWDLSPLVIIALLGILRVWLRLP